MKKLSIGDAVSLISIAGAAIVCVSVAYEYGYAAGAGLSLLDLSLSPQDFVKSAAAWAPSLFLGFIGIFALEATTSAIEGGRTDEEIIQSTGKPELWRKIRHSPDYLFLALGLILAAAVIFGARFIQPFAHRVYSVIWLSLAGFLVTRDSLRRKFPPRLLFAVWGVVGIAFIVYGGGKQDALTSAHKEPIDEVETVAGSTMQCRLMRRYSEFVLVIPKGAQYSVLIPTGEVKKIRRANQALLPTTTAVTPAATHPSRQP